MAVIKSSLFRGARPYVDSATLGDDDAQNAEDCILESGLLKPARAPTIEEAINAGIKTIYRNPDNRWFRWSKKVDAVPALEQEDPYYRVLFTSDDKAPQLTYSPAYQNDDNPTSWNLGVPAPATTVQTTVTGTLDESLGGLRETRFYVATYVDMFGAESAPSPVGLIDEVEVDPGQSVDVTAPTAPTGSNLVTSVNIYRTSTGSSSSAFLYVGSTTFGATFTDNIDSGSLQETLITADFDVPKSSMRGIITHPAGFFVGFFGNTICFSEPGYYYAWPVKYRIPLTWDIVGLAVAGDTLIVLTKGRPYFIFGVHPANMSATATALEAACVSKDSILEVGNDVMFATRRGLVKISASGTTEFTRQLFTREQWTALAPETINAFLWRGLYLAFYDNGTDAKAVAVNPLSPEVGCVFFNYHAVAGFNDLDDEVLFLNMSNSVMRWDDGVSTPYVWRSKKFVGVTPANPGAAKVLANSYPVTFKLFAEGSLIHTQTVTDEEVFRLPAGYRAFNFEFELSGSAEVREVQIGHTVADLRQI